MGKSSNKQVTRGTCHEKPFLFQYAQRFDEAWDNLPSDTTLREFDRISVGHNGENNWWRQKVWGDSAYSLFLVAPQYQNINAHKRYLLYTWYGTYTMHTQYIKSHSNKN